MEFYFLNDHHLTHECVVKEKSSSWDAFRSISTPSSSSSVMGAPRMTILSGSKSGSIYSTGCGDGDGDGVRDGVG